MAMLPPLLKKRDKKKGTEKKGTEKKAEKGDRLL